MSTVDLTINNYVATIVLSDPATRNAIDTNMVRELHRVLDAVQKSKSEVRSLVISGSGGTFCSGVDLHSVNLTTPESRQHAYAELRKFLDPLVLRFSQIRHPTVTAINGPAVGAGMSLALAGDLIVMADNTFLWPSFARLGTVPDAGITFRLARRVGGGRALSALLLAEKIDSATALGWGLIHSRVPAAEVLATAQALAQRLAAGPRSVLAQIRTLCSSAFDHSLEEQVQAERNAQERTLEAQECVEGVRAFFEKREPDFFPRKEH